MIVSFRDAATADLYNGVKSARARKFPDDVTARAIGKLDRLNAATDLDDMKVPPSNKLHPLKDEWAGFHGIWVNKKWRIVFRWTAAGPADVELIDYH